MKPSFREASCCSVEVVNGADGFRLRSPRLTFGNHIRGRFHIDQDRLGSLLVGQFQVLVIDLRQLGE